MDARPGATKPALAALHEAGLHFDGGHHRILRTGIARDHPPGDCHGDIKQRHHRPAMGIAGRIQMMVGEVELGDHPLNGGLEQLNSAVLHKGNCDIEARRAI